MSDLQFPSSYRRVRWAMYLAFVVIAGATGLAAGLAQRAEQRMDDAAEMVEVATEQRALVQRIGRVALELAHPHDSSLQPATELTRLLDESKLLAQRADVPLAGLTAAHPAAERARVAWVAARDPLWRQGESLLGVVMTADRQHRDLATRTLVTQGDRAFEASQSLAGALRDVQRGHSSAARQASQWTWLVTLALLFLLAVVVVEPAVRTVERHQGRLVAQAAELERLALVAERTSNLVMTTDIDRRITWVNDAFSRATGFTLDEARGHKPSDLLHSDRTEPGTLARLRESLDRGEGVRAELLNRSKDGRDYWVDIDIRPFTDGAGRMAGFVAVETDITDQVAKRRQLEALLAALPDGVIVQDGDGRIVQVNPAAERLLGRDRADLVDRPVEAIDWRTVHEDLTPYPGAEHPAMRTLADGQGRTDAVIGVPTAGHDARWLLVNTALLPDALGERSGVVSCLVDVTERRRLQDRLARSARVDALTELPNRVVVTERIDRALAHRRRHPSYGFAVLFMDFDRFKQVNDTHGHGVGDQLLKQVAQRLQTTLRPGDAVARVGDEHHTAARLGGDEFVIVLEGMRDEPSVRAVADRLLQSLTQPYQIGHCRVQSGVSIGIVLGPDEQADAGSVLRDADTAMYEAKRAGRGRYVIFHPSMHERVAAAHELENDLRQALPNQELFVVYQPVVELKGGPVAGVEALVRWRHPTRGLVPPSDFIPVAEEVGLIAALGDFVLDAACRQFTAWQDTLGDSAPRALAVNLSRAQLRQSELVGTVRDALARSGMPADALHLEVTESLAAQDSVILERMAELRALGVHLALDDFGTGYSSLACLHQMPIDTVKIDRSFVAHAEHSNYHRVVIEATLRVATALGMKSVAEGIETPGQAALMAELGCGRGQGYLYSRPLDVAALTEWLQSRAGRPEREEDVAARVV